MSIENQIATLIATIEANTAILTTLNEVHVQPEVEIVPPVAEVVAPVVVPEVVIPAPVAAPVTPAPVAAPVTPAPVAAPVTPAPVAATDLVPTVADVTTALRGAMGRTQASNPTNTQPQTRAAVMAVLVESSGGAHKAADVPEVSRLAVIGALAGML